MQPQWLINSNVSKDMKSHNGTDSYIAGEAAKSRENRLQRKISKMNIQRVPTRQWKQNTRVNTAQSTLPAAQQQMLMVPMWLPQPAATGAVFVCGALNSFVNNTTVRPVLNAALSQDQQIEQLAVPPTIPSLFSVTEAGLPAEPKPSA